MLNIKVIAFLARTIPAFRKRAERATYEMMKDLVENHKNGTAYWYKNRNDLRISAFFKGYQEYEAIPDWSADMPDLDPEPEWSRLDHGYDETKAQLDLADLQGAAEFRGGECLTQDWEGDLYATLDWKCAFDHEFTAKPTTVLKAGHWCPECMPPPWNFDEQAKKNPFLAQVWHAYHDEDEDNFYPEDSMHDIVNADLEWQDRTQK